MTDKPGADRLGTQAALEPFSGIIANTPPRPIPPLMTGKPRAHGLSTQAALEPLSCVIAGPPRTLALITSRSYYT